MLLALLVSLAGCGQSFGLRQAPLPDPVPIAVDPTPATMPAKPKCDTGLWLVTDMTETAMGLRLMHVKAFNCGTEPTVLNGYPAVRLLDEQWQPLQVEILQGSGGISSVDGFDDPPQPVTLAPGQAAKSVFMWKNTNTSIDPPQVGRHVDIQVGTTWQPLLAKQPSSELPGDLTIDLGSTGRMGVSAWRAFK